ncbi:MAG: 50S ribosomal protein L6 [Bacteroidia bacterium]
MSRVGKKPIPIPQGVEVKLDKNIITVKGKLGTLTRELHPDMSIKVDNGQIVVERPTEQKRHKALHGLTRALIANMVKGVSEGFKTVQELVGVGYRATNKGQLLDLSLGYSHHIYFELPPEVKVTTKQEKGENPKIYLESTDKELLGLIAAKIRSLRKPEPYKGKGIRFEGENIRRKAGKSASKK